jgi:E3 Ubiquitin ligase
MLSATGAVADAIVGASDFQFGMSLAIGGLLALGAGWGAYAMLIRKRILQDTPTALIRSAPQGYIELQGRAELMDGDPIFAPLSSRTCVWYRYRVEEKHRRRTGNGNRSQWRTVDSNVSDSLFYLVDSTGRCAIDPEGATVTPSSRDVWYGNSRIPGRLDNDTGWTRFTGVSQIGRNFRYIEERIDPGDPLYALGDFTTHGGAGAAFDRSTEVREVLREWKLNNAEMLARFDSNKDGEIDLQEWEGARRAAETEVDVKRSKVAAAPPVDVLGHTRGSRKPFVIAARTEAEMLSRFHWSAVGLLALATVSGAAVLWMLSIR